MIAFVVVLLVLLFDIILPNFINYVIYKLKLFGGGAACVEDG